MAAHPSIAFSPDDWRQFRELLATGRCSGPAPVEPVPVDRQDVASALMALRATVRGEDLLPAGPLTDQLLDLWAVATRVSPEVVQPVETFMTALATRQMVSVGELDAVLAEIENALRWSTFHLS